MNISVDENLKLRMMVTAWLI